MTSVETLYSTAFTFPINGWVSNTSDNSVPEKTAAMLDETFEGWMFMGDHFVLLTADGEKIFWRQGETMMIRSDSTFVRVFNSEEFFGFPIIDRTQKEMWDELVALGIGGKDF